jgi:hypothetical protein
MGKLQNLEVCISECTGLSMLLHKPFDNKLTQPNFGSAFMPVNILNLPGLNVLDFKDTDDEYHVKDTRKKMQNKNRCVDVGLLCRLAEHLNKPNAKPL